MAKIALLLVFSLVLVLSINSAVGHDAPAPSPEQTNQETSEYADATGQNEEGLDEIVDAMSPEMAPASSPTMAFEGSFGPGPAMTIEDGAAEGEAEAEGATES
ncbi:hypothetical protein PVK06_008693 [Gossypium arboreum]|uniref:Uncharacterized protein n=1 Tax=Gossypium arboreum TaxID=29729 RepID=A0ABR0QKU8_GOSAR|nr:hypothetical protein PVK06_008693 [Gossypium arboreum]